MRTEEFQSLGTLPDVRIFEHACIKPFWESMTSRIDSFSKY